MNRILIIFTLVIWRREVKSDIEKFLEFSWLIELYLRDLLRREVVMLWMMSAWIILFLSDCVRLRGADAHLRIQSGDRRLRTESEGILTLISFHQIGRGWRSLTLRLQNVIFVVPLYLRRQANLLLLILESNNSRHYLSILQK